MTRWEVLPPNVKVQSIIGNVKQVSVAGKRESKYHNKIAYYDGIAFDSIKERRCAAAFKMGRRNKKY